MSRDKNFRHRHDCLSPWHIHVNIVHHEYDSFSRGIGRLDIRRRGHSSQSNYDGCLAFLDQEKRASFR